MKNELNASSKTIFKGNLYGYGQAYGGSVFGKEGLAPTLLTYPGGGIPMVMDYEEDGDHQPGR